MLSFAMMIVSPVQYIVVVAPLRLLQARILSAHLQSVRCRAMLMLCIATGFRAESTKHTRLP